MRYLLTIVISVCAIIAHGQQINPVPDYVFQNRMSVGRTGVTDTTAYFSVGPRYGAIRGMMPPMVVDTALITGNKRNGLFIFSIQKNKYLYWDSVGVKWAEMAGTTGSALTSGDTTAMLNPYLRKADTAWLSNRIDLKVNISDTSSMLNPYLRGSGTANYLPIFDASRSVINSKVYQTGTNLLFNTTTPSFTTSGISTIENNATSSAVYTFKTNDSLRAYIGWGGASTMDINNLRSGDIRFYTAATLRGRFQTDGTFRLNSLTGTGDRIVTADANGVLSATSSATGLVDTTVLSTRAWRQKGDDSLGAIIATKGSGTVTSVATGYGLSGGTITTTGTIIVDSAIVASRLRVGKVVDSLALVKQNVLTNPVTGTGTTNYVPKFTGTSTIGNGAMYDDGSRIGIGTTSPQARIWVSGGSLAAASGNDGAGISASLTTGRTGTYDVGTLSSYHNYFDNHSLEMAAGSTGAWISGVSVTGRSATNYGGTVRFTTYGSERGRFTGGGELLLNTTTDAGDYKLQVSGNAYVTGTTVLAASGGEVYVGTTSDAGAYKLQIFGDSYFNGFGEFFGNAATTPSLELRNVNGASGTQQYYAEFGTTSTIIGRIFRGNGASGVVGNGLNIDNYDGFQIRANQLGGSGGTINFLGGETLINTTTDAGDYKLQVSGNAYVTGTTVLAATSGNVGVGTTNPQDFIHMMPITSPSYMRFGFASTFPDIYGRIGHNGNSGGFEIYTQYSSTNVNSGNIRFINGASGSTTEKMRITYDGIVSINNASPNSSAQLDVTSTTRGFLPPRMTTTQRDAISSPAAGLVIYNTTTSKLQVYTTSWTDLH